MKKLWIFLFLLSYTFLNANSEVETNKKICLVDNNGTACFTIGQMYHSGRNGLKKDRKESAKYYELACNQNHPRACGLLGLFSTLGISVQKSDLKAMEYYKKACDLKDGNSCASLSKYYKEGKSVKKDESKAAFLEYKACKNGYFLACSDEKTEDTIANIGCLSGDATSCLKLAIWNIKKRNMKPREVVPLLEKACDLGNPMGCSTLASIHIEDEAMRDYTKAFELAELSCKMKDPAGCSLLGTIYEHGYGKDVNYHKAAKFYKIGCSGKFPRGCSSLAFLYIQGKGVIYDRVKAIELLKESCSYGSQAACKGVYKMLNKQ